MGEALLVLLAYVCAIYGTYLLMNLLKEDHKSIPLAIYVIYLLICLIPFVNTVILVVSILLILIIKLIKKSTPNDNNI